ncbi:hypothetical protein EXIGLDRAFT_450001 [Exidia glandulosa HHB12029]|uniref:Uncharacterized protein n=1 Tax=Exidia glandulosa HHB12029 TaxID=1314781 RepID=A0A165B4L6_EXIGL|nr:hypothetical protein EXIGLDRAFT_450001 [Exidia glandulosa HHB12029]
MRPRIRFRTMLAQLLPGGQKAHQQKQLQQQQQRLLLQTVSGANSEASSRSRLGTYTPSTGLERVKSEKSPKKSKRGRASQFLHHLSSHSSVHDAARSSPNLHEQQPASAVNGNAAANGRTPRPGPSRPTPPQPASPHMSTRSMSPGPPPLTAEQQQNPQRPRFGVLGRIATATGLRRRPKSGILSESMSSGIDLGAVARVSNDSTIEAHSHAPPLSADSRASSWTDDGEGFNNAVTSYSQYAFPHPRSSGDSTGTGDSSRSSDYGDPSTRQVGAGGYSASHDDEYDTHSPTSPLLFGEDQLQMSPDSASASGSPLMSIPRSPALAQPIPRHGIPPHVAANVAASWDPTGTVPSRPQPVLHTQVPPRAGMTSPLSRQAYADGDVFESDEEEDDTDLDDAPAARPRSYSYPLDQRTGSGSGHPRPARHSSSRHGDDTEDSGPALPIIDLQRRQSVSRPAPQSPSSSSRRRYNDGGDDDESSSASGEDDVLEISIRRPSTSLQSSPAIPGSPIMPSPPRRVGMGVIS